METLRNPGSLNNLLAKLSNNFAREELNCINA